MTQHNGTQVEGGKQYSAATEQKHIFWIQHSVMTISYIKATSSQMESEFPKYILESSDGSYHQELSVGGDLIPAGQYMELRFVKLKPGKNYKLTRYIAEDLAEVVFDKAPFEKIIDQDRSIHKILEDHAYGEFQFAEGHALEESGWGPDASVASRSKTRSQT